MDSLVVSTCLLLLGILTGIAFVGGCMAIIVHKKTKPESAPVLSKDPFIFGLALGLIIAICGLIALYWLSGWPVILVIGIIAGSLVLALLLSLIPWILSSDRVLARAGLVVFIGTKLAQLS